MFDNALNVELSFKARRTFLSFDANIANQDIAFRKGDLTVFNPLQIGARLGRSLRARSSPLINREAPGQFGDAGAHFGFYASIARFAMRRQPIERLNNKSPNLGKFGDAKAARCRGGRSQANAGRHRRLLRIKRHAVLIAGDMRAP